MLDYIRTKRDLIVGIVLAACLALVVGAATWGGSDDEGQDAGIDIPASYSDTEESLVAYEASYGYCRLVPLEEIAAELDVAIEPIAIATALADGTTVELREATFDACLAGIESLEEDPAGD